jgi:hypothetical protein
MRGVGGCCANDEWKETETMKTHEKQRKSKIAQNHQKNKIL